MNTFRDTYYTSNWAPKSVADGWTDEMVVGQSDGWMEEVDPLLDLLS